MNTKYRSIFFKGSWGYWAAGSKLHSPVLRSLGILSSGVHQEIKDQTAKRLRAWVLLRDRRDMCPVRSIAAQ